MSVNVYLEGEKALREAFRRNPEYVKRRGLQMMTRLKAVYQQNIIRNPWRVGGSGGGAPVNTRNLVNSHQYTVEPTRMKIEVRPNVANAYGSYVHDGTRKMEARPWLDYAHNKEEREREKQIGMFLEDIIKDLSK